MDESTIAAEAPAAEPNEPSQGTPAAHEPPKALSKQARREQLIARLRGAKSEQTRTPHEVEPQEPKRAPGSPGGPSTEGEPSRTDEPDPKEGEGDDPQKSQPEQPDPNTQPGGAPAKTEKTEDADLKLAATRRELKNAKADLLELKPLADKARQLDEQIAKAKEDPNLALGMLKQLLGRDYGELTSWIVENKEKIQAQQKYADLPPDVREEIEAARKDRLEREQRAKTEAEQRAFVEKHTKYSAKISEYVTTHEDEFPLSAAYGEDVAKDIARLVMAQKGPVDARALIAKYEADTLQGFTAALSNEKLVKHLLTKPEIKSAIAKHLGATPEPKKSPQPGQAVTKPNGQPSSADVPRTLSNGTASADTSQRTPAHPSREQRKQEIREAFRRYKSAV